MPTITTAETICGPRPQPHTVAFLRWVDEYIARRKKQCVFKRSATYYIDSASGSDANNGLSPTTAWASLTPVRTRLAANTSGGDAFLFKRGTTLRDATGIDLSVPNNMFGAYGPLSAGSIDKPILSHFTIRWLAGSKWTLAAGNRYTTTVSIADSNPSSATTIGFLRVAEDPLNPLRCQNTQGNCEAESFSFFVSSGTVHINLGGVDPNTLNIEAVPVAVSPPDGIRISNGSSGVWIDGIRFDGWGCGSKGLYVSAGTQNNESGIRNLAGGTAEQAEHVAYISNCESYYNGGHALSQEPGGYGGTHIVENCVAGHGYGSPNGEACLNSYSGDGSQETVFKDCIVRFGPLPHNVNSPTVTLGQAVTTQGGAFYGHVNAAAPSGINLYLNINCRVLDERRTGFEFDRATTYMEKWTFTELTAGGDMFRGSTHTDPASIKCFVIGWRSPRTRHTATHFTGCNRVIFINSHLYMRQTWTPSPTWAYSIRDFNPMFINCILEIENETGTNCTIFERVATVSAGPRFTNCLILLRGHTANGSNDRFSFCVTSYPDQIRLANTVVVCDRWRDGATIAAGSGMQAWWTVNTGAGAGNTTDHLRYVAIAGTATTDSGNWRGFSNATGLLNLATADDIYPDMGDFTGDTQAMALLSGGGYTLDPASPLAGAGAAVPFADKSDMLPAPEYDFFGRRRPTVPSIGPFDVLNTATGSGGGLASGGSGSSGLLG